MPVAADNDSTALVAAVRRDLFTAGSDDNWTDEKILAIADDCLLEISGALKAIKQEWFAKDFDLAIEADVGEYELPEQTAWGSLENVYLVEIATGRIVKELGNVSSSQRPLYQPGNDGLSGTPAAAYFRDDTIVLSPVPDDNAVSIYSVTVAGYREPGQLCKTSEVVRVTAVNSVTQTLTVSTRPSSWATDSYTSGTPYRVDVYGRNKPNAQLLWNKLVTAPSSTAFIFSPSITAAEFASISVGDVVTMKDTTPYVDLPRGAVPYLRRMVKKVITTAQTDTQALQAYLSQEAQAAALFIAGMKNRHDGKAKKISLLHAGAARFMRR